MELIGKHLLHTFKREHPDARSQLEAWEKEVEGATWKTPHDLKERYPRASIVKGKNVIFDFCWNKYRLWVKVAFNTGAMFVKAIGNHQEYESWTIE